MKTVQAHSFGIVAILAAVLLSTFFVTSEASAQRRRIYVGRSVARVSPRAYYPVYVGGRRFFYNGGFFYRGGRWGYTMIPAPIGARIRVLPFGFISFSIGAVPYYYYGGAYYQYIPDQNVYVVVQKPSSGPSSVSTDNEDKAVLTDGTTLSGVFESASADSVQFRVNGKLRSIPITQITSINFAPSSFDTTGHK